MVTELDKLDRRDEALQLKSEIASEVLQINKVVNSMVEESEAITETLKGETDLKEVDRLVGIRKTNIDIAMKWVAQNKITIADVLSYTVDTNIQELDEEVRAVTTNKKNYESNENFKSISDLDAEITTIIEEFGD